jgi:hypothetical protein
MAFQGLLTCLLVRFNPLSFAFYGISGSYSTQCQSLSSSNLHCTRKSLLRFASQAMKEWKFKSSKQCSYEFIETQWNLSTWSKKQKNKKNCVTEVCLAKEFISKRWILTYRPTYFPLFALRSIILSRYSDYTAIKCNAIQIHKKDCILMLHGGCADADKLTCMSTLILSSHGNWNKSGFSIFWSHHVICWRRLDSSFIFLLFEAKRI